MVDLTIFHEDENRHRTSYFPGDDLSNAPQEVQDAAAKLWTAEAVAAWRESMVTPPPEATPNYAGALAALLVAPVYNRVLQLGMSHLPVALTLTNFGTAFGNHATLTHAIWAEALSASAAQLAMAINATDAPLMPEEIAWVDDWNDVHNLGLNINWGAANG